MLIYTESNYIVVGDNVFLKESLSKKIVGWVFKVSQEDPILYYLMRFQKKIGQVAHRLALPPNLGNICNIFHMSQLRNYVFNPKYMIHQDEMIPNLDLRPEAIFDRKVQQIRNKLITSVKVLWRHYGQEKAMWNIKDKIKEKYPSLFK